MTDHQDFLEAISTRTLSNDEGYYEGQYGKVMQIFETSLPEIDTADIVILGVTENRGEGTPRKICAAAETIRKELYKLHYWHADVRIADFGNIKTGATLKDSYAALRTEVAELILKKKIVLIIGGSHDNTIAQYQAYKQLEQAVTVTNIDSTFDLSREVPFANRNFLMDLLTTEPNFIRHYNHVGFQSYFVHPNMLETIDKLRFDSYRVGLVQTEMEEVEPVFRDSNLITFDICAIKNSDAPANKNCPNGFTGVEACTLMRYAGMSAGVSSLGIYGYNPEQDVDNLTAKQISQMIWYFVDGVSRRKQKADLADRNQFNEYHNVFNDVETVFLQSKRTGRWWMQMPNGQYIACSYADYLKSCRNEIPERWLREQERVL